MPGRRSLQDISCHFIFWWRDFLLDYQVVSCTPPADTEVWRIRWTRYQHGFLVDPEVTVTFYPTEDTYTALIRGIAQSGDITDYNADVSASYFDDPFHLTLNYTFNSSSLWSRAAVTKSYSATETYAVDITPCWSGSTLTGYRTAVYGGAYNGEGVIVGQCP